MAETLQGATPEHQARLIRHIVERVVIADGQVVDVVVRLEARPFFGDLRDGMAMAPPDRHGALAPTWP